MRWETSQHLPTLLPPTPLPAAYWGLCHSTCPKSGKPSSTSHSHTGGHGAFPGRTAASRRLWRRACLINFHWRGAGEDTQYLISWRISWHWVGPHVICSTGCLWLLCAVCGCLWAPRGRNGTRDRWQVGWKAQKAWAQGGAPHTYRTFWNICLPVGI